VPLTHTLWSVSDRARHTRCGRSPTEPPRANLDGRAGAVRRPARARHTRCGRSPTEPPRANLDGRASAVRRPARARHTRCGRSPTEPPAGLWLVARARSGDRPEPDTHAAAGLRPSQTHALWPVSDRAAAGYQNGQAGAVRRPARARHTLRPVSDRAAAGYQLEWSGGRGQETGPSQTHTLRPVSDRAAAGYQLEWPGGRGQRPARAARRARSKTGPSQTHAAAGLRPSRRRQI